MVCYLLGVTEVPPESITLIFERFISKERGEPPDIDVDFEHERREEVIQWIYERYGRDRAGLTATVIHFRSRAAIREVGKVMGLSQDVVAALVGPDLGLVLRRARTRTGCAAPASTRPTAGSALTARLIGEIIGFPRHLSASMSAASSSPRAGWTSSARSRMPRWRIAPSSNGTRTTSTRWGF